MNESIFKTELTKLLIIVVCDRTSCMLIEIFKFYKEMIKANN